MVALSLSHLTVLNVAPPALFDLAAQAGYQNVGIRIFPAVPGAVSYPLGSASLAEWRIRMADAGVAIHDVEFIPVTPELRVGDYAAGIALAAELGAKRLNVSGDDADADRLAVNFGALCDIAADAGMGVDLEFMRFRTVGTLHKALDTITRAARPNGRLLIDLLHLFRSGGTADMLRHVPIDAFGSVQLCDAPLQDPGDADIVDETRLGRLFPGEGGLPLLELMNALPSAIPVSVEVPTGRTHPSLSALQTAIMAQAASLRLLQSWQPSR